MEAKYIDRMSTDGILFDGVPPVTDRDRQCVELLMGDLPNNRWIVQYFFVFNNFVLRDEIYRWLFKNRLTGRRFLEFLAENGWLVKDRPPSLLEPAKYILMRVKRDRELSPICAGRDYKVD